MKFKDLTKWVGVFILAVALIVIYKTFDNLDGIIVWTRWFFGVLSPALIGMGVAYVLYPAAVKTEEWLDKVKIKFVAKRSRVFAVLSVYIVAIAALAFLVGVALNPLIAEANKLFESLPFIIENINKTGLITLNYEDIMHAISIEKLMTYVNMENWDAYVNRLRDIGAGLFNALLVLVTSIYVLIDRDSLKKFCDRIGALCFKPRAYTAVKNYLQKFNELVHKYLFCLIIAAGIVGTASFVVLWALRVPYAPVLALLIGMMNVIPYFGSLLSGVIATVITAFTGSVKQAVWVAVALVILQQIDGNFTQPRLASHSLKVRPFWVIVGVVIGGGMFGLLGMMLAAPVTAFLKIIVTDLFDYFEKKKKANEQLSM